MTVLARRVASIPVRLATDTWNQIVALAAPPDDAIRTELLSVAGIAASLITRKTMKDSAVVFAGNGPQVRFYCVYGDDAIEGATANEAALPSSPLATEVWTVSLPCPAEDLSWVQESLGQLSSRVTARDAAQASSSEAGTATTAAHATVDRESFRRP